MARSSSYTPVKLRRVSREEKKAERAKKAREKMLARQARKRQG